MNQYDVLQFIRSKDSSINYCWLFKKKALEGQATIEFLHWNVTYLMFFSHAVTTSKYKEQTELNWFSSVLYSVS